MPFARASELDRLLLCPGPAILVRADESTKSPRSKEAAAWGTAIHAWKETGTLPNDPKIRSLFNKKLGASGVDRVKLWPVAGEHEVALAFNVVTGVGRRCTVPVGAAADEYRATWKSAFDDQWVTGTLDYVMELLGGPWVDDLKTGRYGHPKDYEAQQTFYCLAWGTATYGEITPTRSTITHWPKYPTAAHPVRLGSVFNLDYLKAFWKRLQGLRAQILRLQPLPKDAIMGELSTGEQCMYCPSRAACPKISGD